MTVGQIMVVCGICLVLVAVLLAVVGCVPVSYTHLRAHET